MPVKTPVGLNPDIPLVIKRELDKLSASVQTVHANVGSIKSAQTEVATRVRKAVTKLKGANKQLTGGVLSQALNTLFDAVGPGALTQFPGAGFGPLAITGLLGHAAQPQIAGVPNLTKLPVGGPYAQPGSLVSVNGVLYGYTTGPNTAQLPYVQPFLSGTHAQRLANFPAANYPPGMVFFETDRSVFYVVELIVTVPTWVYAAGRMICAFSTTALPVDLALPDAGFLVWETTTKHQYIWSGAIWTFADEGNTQICAFGNTTPTGGVWGLCDGSVYACARADGAGTFNVTTPNLTNNVFIKGGLISGQQAATPATWDVNAKTDDESSHTHSVHVIGNNSYGAGVFGAVADQTVSTSSGSAHHHNLSNSNALLNAPSEVNGGLPLRITMAWYMRR